MSNRLRCTLLLLLSFFVSAEAFCRNDATAAEFRDPTAEERAMTSVPFAPGASATVRFRVQVSPAAGNGTRIANQSGLTYLGQTLPTSYALNSTRYSRRCWFCR